MARPIHPNPVRGSQHPSAKLTESDIPVIFALASEGLSPHVIGTRFGVGRMTVKRVLSRKTWAHVQVSQ